MPLYLYSSSKSPYVQPPQVAPAAGDGGPGPAVVPMDTKKGVVRNSQGNRWGSVLSIILIAIALSIVVSLGAYFLHGKKG